MRIALRARGSYHPEGEWTTDRMLEMGRIGDMASSMRSMCYLKEAE